MLTYTQIENHAQYTLEGGTTLPQGITLEQVIDQAGKLFYNMHPWNFRENQMETVDFIADQKYVEMPLDFQSLTGLEMTNALTSGIALVTPREIMRRRATSVTVRQSYYWASLVTPRRRSRSGDFPQPRLELWPTPSNTETDVLTIIYRSRWVPFADATADTSVDTAPVPEYAETAFLEVLRALTAGWGERLNQPQGGVTALVQRVKEGPVFEAAVCEDGYQQFSYGPLIGGAIQSTYPLTELFSTAAASADPS